MENVKNNCENKLAKVKEIETERKEFQLPQLFNLSSLAAIS
ncbi:hypothetical protein FQU75_05135 [Paenibacillus polymyxa]|nr:hypothetical protein FQU75_05135 [Paenibacillus polymyxa]